MYNKSLAKRHQRDTQTLCVTAVDSAKPNNKKFGGLWHSYKG